MVMVIDRVPITIMDGSRGLHMAEAQVTSPLYSGLSFRSLLSLGGGTGNAPYDFAQRSLITEHHFVPTRTRLWSFHSLMESME